MKYLFVGGPMNDKLLYDLQGTEVRVPVGGSPEFSVYIYKRSSLVFDECGLFIPDDWSEPQAMSFLIEMYSNYSLSLDVLIDETD